MMRSQGSVLIVVLWIVLVLSLVSFSLASAVRLEMTKNQHAFDSERAFFMAKGAADIVYNSFAKGLPIPVDTPIKQGNGEYIFPFESGEVTVRFESNAGLIDLNAASDELLASMFDSVGVDRETRNRLVDSTLDWRDKDDIPHLYGAERDAYPEKSGDGHPWPRNAAFETVDELLLVKNMRPEIFYGAFVVDPGPGQYRKLPGVRDLVTVRSGSEKVDPNIASYNVLTALPWVGTPRSKLIDRLIAERTQKPFSSAADLLARMPELAGARALNYMDFIPHKPAELVSRATISSSGVSRTVRLLLKRVEKVQNVSLVPLVFSSAEEIQMDRWRMD